MAFSFGCGRHQGAAAGQPGAGRRRSRDLRDVLHVARRPGPSIFRWRSGSTRCSSVMILVITGIGTLIHLYSTAYMHDETDGEYARYFSYLNLFAAFMLVLVLGASFPVMFIGWEGVGLCSYLLIGFWFTKPSAAEAGKKAFIVNRIGDFGFILGMLIALLGVRHARLPGRGVESGRAAHRVRVDGRRRHPHGGDAAAVPGRDRQVRAASALRLAAGRDGRPDAGVRADSCGDDGDGGRVHDRAQRGAVHATRRSRSRSSPLSASSRRCSPARSASCRTTSSACWRIRRSRSSATCSWRWASARLPAASSISTRTRSSRRCCSSVPARSFTRSPASRTCATWAACARRCPSRSARS